MQSPDLEEDAEISGGVCVDMCVYQKRKRVQWFVEALNVLVKCSLKTCKERERRRVEEGWKTERRTLTVCLL